MQLNDEKLQSLVGRVVSDLSASYGGVMISIGDKLGLYRAMAGAGPLSSAELARRSGCAERYVREWLNSQVAGGYVSYHATSATYELTAEQAAVFADSDSPYFFPLAWECVAGLWLGEERTLDAFRTGRGVSWGEQHPRLSCGSAAFFRNGYRASLIDQWLPALDGVVERLREGATVADVGCGHGYSTVFMAESFPESRFYGFDPHEASIDAARRQAERAGVADRVRFETRNATDYPDKDYDLICFFDCLHDLGDPVGAAAHAASVLSPEGRLLLVEPYAGDRVEENVGPVGRLYYSASTAVCCAHSLSEKVGLALGAQAGERRLAEVFRQAGFRHFERVLQTPFNLVLEARL